MSTPPRTGDTLEKILEIAEGEFAREGYAGAHLQSIAEQVGVQKTALYYYFTSKAALYVFVLSRMLETFDLALSQAIEADVSHEEKLDRLLRSLNDILAERRNYSQILIRIFVDRANIGEEAHKLKEPVERVVGRILVFFREGVEAGAFRHLSPRHFFQTVLGSAVFHYAARNFSAAVLGVDDVFTHSAVAWRRDELRKIVLHGVLPAGSAETDGTS
jgi:TetR/AcrR family transcriptional regulator